MHMLLMCASSQAESSDIYQNVTEAHYKALQNWVAGTSNCFRTYSLTYVISGKAFKLAGVTYDCVLSCLASCT